MRVLFSKITMTAAGLFMFAGLFAAGHAQTATEPVIKPDQSIQENNPAPADPDAAEKVPAPETGVDQGSDDGQDATTGGDPSPTTKEIGAALEPAEIPNIITDLSQVPFPVRKMRELILEAAKSGDIEKLRPYIGYGDDVTMLSLGGFDEDPIEFLKSLSGDPEGHEILAIITEILEAPAVKIEERTGEEVFVWPYFYSYPYEKLTPEQRVQLFRIITYGDYEEMVSFGNYIFYRLGITPEGRWRFFVAGD